MARHKLSDSMGTAIELQSSPLPARLSKPELTRVVATDINASESARRYRFGRNISLDGIETAVRLSEYGAMERITDLSRETIDTDPHLAAVLNKRFGSVSSLPHEIRPATGPGIDKDKAKFYAQCVQEQISMLDGFRDVLLRQAWALFDGRAAQEMVWRFVNGASSSKHGRVTMMLDEIAWIHPRRINFGPRRELRVVPENTGYSGNFAAYGLSLHPDDMKKEGNWRKFIQWTPSHFGEYGEREGLARRCLYYSFFKRYAARERMILLELFGKPWRVLEVPNDSTANHEDLIVGDAIIDGLGGAYSARLPRGTKLDVVQPGEGASETHADVVKHSDEQISKLVLGQIGTTDGVPAGMNSPQANVMQGEQQVILQSDAYALSEIIERDLVDAFIEVNFGWKELAHSPTFRLRFDLPTDRKREVERVDAALKAGIPVSLAEAYEVSGFRVPSEDEAVLRIDQPPTPPTSPVAPAPRPVVVYPTNTSPPAGEQLPAPAVSAQGPGGKPPTATVGSQAVEKFITVNEAREAQGLGPLKDIDGKDDPDGNLTITEFEKRKTPKPDPVVPPPLPIGDEPVEEDEEDEPEEDEETPDGFEVEDEEVMATLLRVASSHVAAFSHDDHVCLAVESPLEWEDSPFGSPEDIMKKGEKQLWRASEKWARQFAEATKDKDRPLEVYNALNRAQEKLDLYLYARPLERSMIQSAALGVLDVAKDTGFIDDTGKPTKAKAQGSTILAGAVFADTAFETAMKWFKTLKLLPRAEFEKLSSDAKRQTFTVAGIQSQQMLAVAQDELAKQIAIGAAMDKFSTALMDRFKTAGMVPSDLTGSGALSASHIETVYRTNAANTYGVGRKTMQTQPAVVRAFPVWEFSPVGDNRSRPTHSATKGRMLLATDPFWKTAYPPYGFNCRCRVITRGPEYLNQVISGSSITGLPDPGFTSGLV